MPIVAEQSIFGHHFLNKLVSLFISLAVLNPRLDSVISAFKINKWRHLADLELLLAVGSIHSEIK